MFILKKSTVREGGLGFDSGFFLAFFQSEDTFGKLMEGVRMGLKGREFVRG